MKIRKYTFCREFNWGHVLIYWNFYDNYVTVVTSLVFRTQSVQCFAQQFPFTTRQVLHGIASYEKSEQV